MSTESENELKVTFHPQLHLQRQIWVLDILRREGVDSILDIGCGEGSLLQCLTEPSWSLPPTTSLPQDSPFVSGTSAKYHADLHLKELHGLDPYYPDLELAISSTVPPNTDSLPFNGYERWVRRNARWMPLEVNIWQGGFETINEAFEGDKIDAFVASEVIEHLPSGLLPLFAPILLGRYRPRLLLLTTPNYAYNERFTCSGEVDPTGYPDPTGRTDRVFRHHDHKFEWTTEEWTQYCTAAASEYGYAVDIGGVGLAVEPDPWNREAKLGHATQVAAFRRLDSTQPKTSIHTVDQTAARPHVLRAKHFHLTHPLSLDELACPPVMADIRAEVKAVMLDSREGAMTFADVWKQGEVSLKCKGDIGALVRAFQTPDLDPGEWAVEEAKGWEGSIEWKSFVAPESPPFTMDINRLQISSDWAEHDSTSEEGMSDGSSPQDPVALGRELSPTNPEDVPNIWGQGSWGGASEKLADSWSWDVDPPDTTSWVSSPEPPT